jgi:predicted nucleic acid-binding protein
MIYLVDSDAVIDYLKGFDSSVVFLSRLANDDNDLCTCSVVIAEVFSGLALQEQAPARGLLDSYRFLSTSEAAARQAGEWRFQFRTRGVTLSTTDMLLAATALEHGSAVITGNLAHFPMSDVNLVPLPRANI